jgi:hypothetical protein
MHYAVKGTAAIGLTIGLATGALLAQAQTGTTTPDAASRFGAQASAPPMPYS